MTESQRDWYKDAIFYEVYVRGFFDSSSDGNGDLRGLTEKLDYLQDLGVDCIWLHADLSVAAQGRRLRYRRLLRNSSDSIGTIEDFKALLTAAHERGIRVITDLVLNHTSDQHPWFQAARARPKLALARLLRLERHRSRSTRTRGSSSWTSKRRTGRGTRSPASISGIGFSRHQPDLNYDNPASARKSRRSWPSGSTWASMAFASMPCHTFSSAKARLARICPRRTFLKGTARATGREVSGDACCSPRRTSGRTMCCLFRQWR